jgi:nitroreductase
MDEQKNNDAKSKIALLRGVRQVRQFSDKPVPPDAIHDILEVARWTGSGMNRQPWEFVLVRDKAMLQEIAQAEGMGSHLAGAQSAIVVVMADESREIESYDEGRLAERMLLAAAAHGVGAGIWWFKDDGAAAKRLLGIPAERRVRTAISLGYPKEDTSGAPPKRGDGRKPQSELVHEEHY